LAARLALTPHAAKSWGRADQAHRRVAVVRDAAGMRIKVDNHYVLGGTAAAGDLRQLAHLPPCPSRPRRVAFLAWAPAYCWRRGRPSVESIDVVNHAEVAAAHAHSARRASSGSARPRVR
jgi:hypothetical protein